MATVKKISRSISYLPPIKTLADWFSYAFKSSELDEVYRFPTLSPSTEKEKEIGQAHHMFSRFLNPRIYEFVSIKILCFVFYKEEVFY
jgi:hypothetical protein